MRPGIHILILSQHFWPESFRINEVAAWLHDAGCRVTVLTGQPNYPEGKVFPGYSSASLGTERHAGYDIVRVPLVPRGRSTASSLVVNYTSFILAASIFGPLLLRGQRIDAVFVYGTSPILQAIPAILLKRLKRVPLTIWVQDLWPQSLVVSGLVKSPILLKTVERVVAWIYRRTDLLLTQSRSFVPIVRDLAGPTVVEYFPNPTEVVPENDAPGKPALVLEPGFNVVFAGNLGRAQGLDTVVAAAQHLQSETDIRFVMIGSGSRSDWLRQTIADLGLRNISLPGRFAASEMPGILSQASALLVTLNRNPAMSLTIPSKVQAYLAIGRPIVAALDGEGAQVVRDAGAGVTVPAEDARALANAILGLRNLPAEDRLQMGVAGRRYHATHFDARLLTERLVERLRALVARTASNGTGRRAE